MTERHAQNIEKAMQARRKLEAAASRGRWRQKYHFMAPGGWINDPNGCIYYRGQYHLFYQHNPYAAVWGSIHWGHAVSGDLVNWRHLPIALAPSEPYDDHPQGGVFSGSAVEDGDELAVLYTATTDFGHGFEQSQCLARSADGGVTFEKFEGNPVIAHRPEGVSSDFRDPRVLRHDGHWYMVLGGALGRGAKEGGEGCALLYQSDDLKVWEYRGIIARSNGRYGSMWECPDLFLLDGKWVLCFSPMCMGEQKSVYLVGDMDFENAQFTWRQEGELDWGSEYYAAQSMRGPDGRTVLMAWQNGWDWMPWWRGFGPAQEEGWRGCMALPRQISLDAQHRILSAPVTQLQSLRGQPRALFDVALSQTPLPVPCEDAECFELLVQISTAEIGASKVHIDLRAGEEKRTRLTLDFADRSMRLDRNDADEGHSGGVRQCSLSLEEPILEVRVFSDTSSIEVFADGGRACMSNAIYPAHAHQEICVHCEGGVAVLRRVEVWKMNAAKEAEWLGV